MMRRILVVALGIVLSSCPVGGEQPPADFVPGIQSKRRVGTGLTFEEERAFVVCVFRD